MSAKKKLTEEQLRENTKKFGRELMDSFVRGVQEQGRKAGENMKKNQDLISFGSDMTLRWACRKGDYIFWAKFQGIFSSQRNKYKITDIWELRDGNFITLTNRHTDLPDWFELHPLEVSGSLVWWMKRRIDEGYKPQEPLDGPNLWRVLAGDWIVWVGPARGGVDSEDGVLGLVNFNENALVYGEPLDLSSGFPMFGGFDRGQPSPEGEKLCRTGWDALNRSGIPRTASADDQMEDRLIPLTRFCLINGFSVRFFYRIAEPGVQQLLSVKDGI